MMTDELNAFNDIPLDTLNALTLLARGDTRLVEKALIESLVFQYDPGFWSWITGRGHWIVDTDKATRYIQMNARDPEPPEDDGGLEGAL